MHVRLLILFLIVLTNNYIASEVENYIECDTDECKKGASDVLSNLNDSVDPCDNFYQFACGGWIENHPIDKSHPATSVFKILYKKTIEQIKEILEDEPKPDDTCALGKARNLYNLCMDVEKLESIGIIDLNKYLQLNGGWPMIMSTEEWESNNYTWQQISENLENVIYSNGLYSIVVKLDPEDYDKYVIVIDEPVLSLKHEILIGFEENSTQKETYISNIQEIAQIFIDENETHINNTTLAQDVDHVVDFEIKLAKLVMSHRNNSDINYEARTIQELQQEYDEHSSVTSQINWYDIIQKMFAQVGITVESSEKLYAVYNYLINLASLLDQTPSRTIVNYMQWSFVRKGLSYTDNRMGRILSRMKQRLRDQGARWKTCLNRDNLNMAISYEYANRYVPSETKQDIKDMVEDIKNVVREQISTSTWMDDDIQAIFLDKLENMKVLISTPDWFSNDTIDDYYDNVAITSGYFESAMNLFKFEMSNEFLNLREPIDEDDSEMKPTIVNAFYKFDSNAIIIPAAIMQDPLYVRNRPAFMNYAALGFIIGHEINHGFDNLGRKYDKNGVFIEQWKNETIEKYEKLAQCFVEQYNGYKWPGLGESHHIFVNGQSSLGENIADSAGIIAVYNAYTNKKAKLNESEVRLSGLEKYSNDQIFFMNYAQTFCDSVMPQNAWWSLSKEHPRSETRILGTLSNFPQFSIAYNCSEGKEMNPEKKCALWQ